MRFLSNNVAVIHVFLLVAAYVWLFGGTRAEFILPVIPWFAALLLEAMVCFPQRHEGETTYEARARVWHAMRKDPLVWVSCALTALLMIPFFNKGLCPVCDYPAIQAGTDPRPLIPFFPFCVDRLEHLNVVLWFVPSLAAAVATKHSLLKSGKRALLGLVVWNGMLLGVVGALQQMTGAQGPLWFDECKQSVYFFSTFGYPNMAGAYFTLLFGIAIAMWRWSVGENTDGAKSGVVMSSVAAGASPSAKGNAISEGAVHRHHHHRQHVVSGPKRHVQYVMKHLYLIPAVIFFACALDTLSRAAILLVTVLTIIYFLHAFVSSFAKMKKAKRVKAGAFLGLVLVLVALCGAIFTPENLHNEVSTLDTVAVLDRMTGKGQYHVRVATEIWKDNFLFGVGGWGYRHFCIQNMTDEELRTMQTSGGANVHNDYLQFLAEHGIVGFGLIVAIVVLLIWPIGSAWKALVQSVRFLPAKDQPPRPVQIFVLPAPVFCILLAGTAVFVHAFGDCPFRSPAVLSLFFVSLAAAEGFLPRLHREHREHSHHHH